MDDRDGFARAMIGERPGVPWPVIGLLAAALAGCSSPAVRDTHLQSPYRDTRVVAIAPFVNQSGSADVEPLVVSDLFFSELQMVRGFAVLPVNRSLQAMAALRMHSLRSPADAIRLAEAVGADMIVVGAITAYDPYDPPELGLAVQLYVVPGRGLDDGCELPADGAILPRAQLAEVYNARHDIIRKRVQHFAEIRGSDDSPLGWRLYTKSIRHYVRFASYQAICQIIELEANRLWIATSLDGAEPAP